jgi:putative phosphoesterase
VARARNLGITLGLIADTHGLLRPEAIRALAGVDRIIHAGDIGDPEVLQGLREIAPVVAIRGNVDTGSWARRIPERQLMQIEAVTVHVLHDLKQLDVKGLGDDCQVVIAGHSHQPGIVRHAGVLFVNPGSAGPRRFRLPVAVGLLHLERGNARARIQLIL